MIKYDAVQNKYLYKMEDIDKILENIQNGNYYSIDDCTQEKVSELAKTIKDFMEHMEITQENVILERHETEEEAREYFGVDFISKFDQLLTTLDCQETVVALHGTNVEVCPSICEEGLKYKSPSSKSTVIQQKMNYGQKEMHYENYESLLNWPHKHYKGLVIVAIPYECFYKEGLWNHYQNTDLNLYGSQDYKIDPDFIVGYIDVDNKQIVLNPKYNRQHNYTGYVNDYELFREQLYMNNGMLKDAMIKSGEQMSEVLFQPLIQSQNDEDEQFDLSRVPYIIGDLIGIFNSIKLSYPDGMPEEKYKYLLEQLSYGFNGILKNISLLKTNEQVQREREKESAIFNDVNAQINQQTDFDNVGLFDDFVWDESIEKNNGRTF